MSPGEAARPTRLGRYELITRIGQGGMAEVQLALQRGPAGFEKLVVVKLVHDNLATQKAFVDMLLDEARVAALVKHPNVVDIYDLGQADGRYFIAMEYLEGEPLLGVLRAGREGKRLDPLSTGRLIADTAEGLDAAHELRSMAGERLELVHHDISLGNIVVLYNGQVKLVDFGVAKATNAAGGSGKVQGKFSYMAPEKLKGAQGDRRSDIFSLGCVMWEALTLKRLFRGGNDTDTMKQVLESTILPPSKVNGDVPHEFDAIVMRALERDPDKRHSNAKDMAVEIEEVLRKRGYGAKNDKIAKYMQETFKGHIEARKKLVQEVVAKGSASAEVLDAAFNSAEVATGSPATPTPVPGDFSGKYRSNSPATGVPAVGNAWADASRPTEISAPPIMETPDGPKRRELPSPGRTKAGSMAPPPRPTPPPRPAPTDDDDADDAATVLVVDSARARATTADVDPPVLSSVEVLDDDAVAAPVPPRTGLAAILAHATNRWLFIGAGAVLLIAVIMLATRGNGDTKAKAGSGRELAGGAGSSAGSNDTERGSSDDTTGSDTTANSGSDTANSGSDTANSGSGSGSGSDTTAGSGSDTTGGGSGSDTVIAGNGSDEIEIETGSGSAGSGNTGRGSGHTGRGSATQPHVAVERLDVPATVNKALQSFVKGDAKGALALLQKAKAAKPGYAPTYRVLGRVYKKLGDNANAKRAFARYLQLNPTAPDAPQIKDEITKL